MIKFFRKIRQKTLIDNKFSKYLMYAIGEIVLVVIGILIALQINNSNEIRIAKIFERKMLNEIRKDLILDTIYFNAVKGRPMSVENAADRFIKMKRENIIVPDSVGILFEDLGTNFNFSYHKGAYESLKSVGLDKISNDSLRSDIAELYDFNFPRTQDLVDPLEEETDDHYRKTFDMFFVIDFRDAKGGKQIPVLTIAPSELLNKARFLNTVNYKKGYAINSIRRLESITRSVSHLLKKIDLELNIEDPEKNRPKRVWN